MSDWKMGARRGQLMITVYTDLRAEQDQIPVEAGAPIVTLVTPDDMPEFNLGFKNMESLLKWIDEMAPHEIVVKCAPEELSTIEPFRAIFERALASTVH